MRMVNIRKRNTKKILAVLVILLLIFNCITPSAVSAEGSDRDENDLLSINITADPDSAPYLAGSIVKFTVNVKNKSSKEIGSDKLKLKTSISNASIADDNPDAVVSYDKLPQNIKAGATWSAAYTVTLRSDLKSLSDVRFKADLTYVPKKNETYALSAEKDLSVKALENMVMLESSDLGSDFSAGGKFHLSYSYKNYNTSDLKYDHKLLIDGKEIDSSRIDWIKAPAGKTGPKKTETVEVKIDNSIFPAGQDSCIITLVLTDENGNISKKDIKVAKADVSEITGGMDLDKLYYGSVKNDDTAPFHDAAGLRELLKNSSSAHAKNIWEKYQYDLWDPNFSDRGGCGALDLKTGDKYKESSTSLPDYADELLKSTSHEYPKDENGPFHNSPEAEIRPVDSTLTDDGVLLNEDEEQFTDLGKTAGPDTGDANKDRSYEINLKATADLKQTKPIAMVFQIQTSWQMFDLTHANDRASLVNGQKVNEELLSLYEMKQAFRDFSEWISEKSNGALLLGITNFQHGGTHSMVSDTSGKSTRHFTNVPSLIQQGLNGWDSFGDCEHIHYSNQELQNAVKELGDAGNFTNWVDNKGNSVYDKAEIVSVIVGGACETNDLKAAGLLDDIPGKNSGNVKKQYGISTNKGKIDMISWMDYENKLGKFDSGKYYKGVTTRQQFFETLKDLYYEAQGEQKVSDVTMEDTVTAEFDVDIDAIKAFAGDKDVTDQVTIKTVKQADGTTKITCTFKDVANRTDIQMKIPVKAKDDFIGGNNVKTNSGKPSISYGGRIDKDKTFTQEFEDVPTVNVPVRFKAVDGENVTIPVGDSASLKDLAQTDDGDSIITKDVEDWIKKYDQIEGTLTYQWVDENGDPVGDPSSAVIDRDHRTPPDIPDSTFTGRESDIGTKTKYTLRITFDPADVKDDSTNKVSVSRQVEEGEVSIKVTDQKEGRLRVKKVIDDGSKAQSGDEFMISMKSVSGTEVDTSAVLKDGESSPYITVDEETVLDISEIVPMEYTFKGITAGSSQADFAKEHRITVRPGDDITVYVHNEYSWTPYYHDFDSVLNRFTGK